MCVAGAVAPESAADRRQNNQMQINAEWKSPITDHLLAEATGYFKNQAWGFQHLRPQSSFSNIIFPTGPLFVLSPEHAQTLARDGYDKQKIKQHLFEKARIPLTRFAERSVVGLHHRRSRWFEIAGDPDHIGVADRAGDINVVVAGGAGIHSQFVPTSFSF
mgnify:CR=1 FL=1